MPANPTTDLEALRAHFEARLLAKPVKPDLRRKMTHVLAPYRNPFVEARWIGFQECMRWLLDGQS